MSLLNCLCIRRRVLPLRVSGVIATSVAHKSPRIRALDLNRDLPSLPLDVDAGVSVFSFACDSPTPTIHGRDVASEV